MKRLPISFGNHKEAYEKLKFQERDLKISLVLLVHIIDTNVNSIGHETLSVIEIVRVANTLNSRQMSSD